MKRLGLLILAAALFVLPRGASASQIVWGAGDVGISTPITFNDVGITSDAPSTVSDVPNLGYALMGPVTNGAVGNIVYMDFTLLSDRFQMNFALNNILSVPPPTTTITDALSIQFLDANLNLVYAPTPFAASYDAVSGFYLGSVNVTPSNLSGQWFEFANLSFDPSQVEADTSYIRNVTYNPTPEPSTYVLLAISLGVVGFARKRMTKKEM
jgi:hypothetical protein